ncbi:MAG: HyaD/HybD family hydrogenase maturation endopeptidase [Candidatus Wenzhouxiangella sp. M2_3B_020]
MQAAVHAVAPAEGTAKGAEAQSGTLVIGIGNSLFGDDGAGIHVIEALEGFSLPDDVELVDGGTLSFTLLEMVENAARLIVVDAARLDAEPGTVRVFHDAEMDDFLNSSKRPSVHEVNLLDVLVAARLRGRMPARYSLVGIQPMSLEWSATPTPVVAEGVARAAEIVAALCEERT